MWMAVVVQKYGGSSVADVDRLRKVAERVMATHKLGHDVVVVVSAMGDTTDELLTLAKKVSANPDRRELDMLLSAGERISMALLSMAIRERGGDAISFTGSQSGIITNDRHIDARIIEVRPFRVQDELSRGKIVVIAGYQGVSYKKEVTTLGRGGSDTLLWPWPPRSMPNTARSVPMSTACIPPIRASYPAQSASVHCPTKRRRKWPRLAQRC
jgi:aspartate kinase